MADQIITRFGALDSRLATAVRHALDVAVTFTALAPMNDVHLRLIAMDEIIDADRTNPDPPSHRWHELMAQLFGRNVVAFRRLPLGPAPAHNEFAESYVMNESERRVVGSLFAASGAFIIAESIALSDAVRRRNVCGGRETFVGDDLIWAVQQSSQVGLALIESSETEAWWQPLFRREAPPSAAVPRQPRPPATAAFHHGIHPYVGKAAGNSGAAGRIAARHHRTILRPIIAASMVLLVVLGLVVVPRLFTFGQTAGSPLALEKPDLKLSIMTTTDLGPFWLAVQQGYFKNAGFTFDPLNDVTLAKSGTESVKMLTEGRVDIAYSTYTPFFVAHSRQAADIQLIAAASVAGPRSCMVVVMPKSKVKEVKDLRKARIAVTARDTISELMVESALRTNGVDYTEVKWVEVPFEEMAEKLAIGEIDAAFMTEPFLSQASKTIGAIPLLDTAVGPTLNLPTAAFGVDGEFAQKYPRTVAAFQAIMRRATIEANTDRAHVEPMLVQHARIDASTAKLPSLLTFQSSLEPAEIQRVADLMRDFEMIPTSIDVTRMMTATLGLR